jgi:ribonuclease PH
MRLDGRTHDQLRPVSLELGFQRHPAGSVLVRWGDTWVLCAANVEERVPPFRAGSGGGWITAEYNMLPGSTSDRKARRAGGREKEIQRLIGRSLRASADLDALGERTVTIDCDVLSADGGTRVASITGGFVALALAAQNLHSQGLIARPVERFAVAAVSVGLLDGQAVLDLSYGEDHGADVDMNVVITGAGELIEVQGTAENGTFSRSQLDEMLTLAEAGVSQLTELQRRAIETGQNDARATVALQEPKA